MTSKILTDEEIIKEIKSGKYRDHYLIYNRKSTDEPENQKNSIRYQNAENLRYVKKHTLRLAPLTLKGFCRDGIISESHSGFKENTEMIFGKGNTIQLHIDRPKFFLLSDYLNRKYFKGCISLCWDRISRNKADNTIVNKLLKNGVNMLFVTTDYDKSSSGELHQDIDGMFAEHHSRVTREKVSLTIKNSRERGLWTNKAPVGYLNQGNMEDKPKDPVRAPLIFQFAKLADKGWSLSDIAHWAIEQEFTMPPMRRRRTIDEVLADEENDTRAEIKKISRLPKTNTIHKILTNRFYTGKIITKDGKWIPSKSHNAIISEELFNRVQEKLQKRNKSKHYANVLDRQLRGMVRCSVCNRVYTPYIKKGILYLGARCDPSCTNPNHHFNFNFIANKIGKLIENLSFTDEELTMLDARTGTEIALLDARRQDEIEKGERKKKTIREGLAYLNAHRLNLLKSNAYTPEGIVSEENKLMFELSLIQEAEVVSDVAMRDTVRDIVKLSELIKNLYIVYENATPQEKEAIIKELFSELTISGEVLEYQCTRGFQPLAHRFNALCDPTGNRTRITGLKSRCPNR